MNRVLLFLFIIYFLHPLTVFSQENNNNKTIDNPIFLEWTLCKTDETNLYMAGSLADAGQFIGMKACDVAASENYHKIVVEVIDESASKTETNEISIFLKNFKKNIDYNNVTKEIKFIINPDNPLCFMTRKKAFKKTDSELLVSCKYLGSETLINEYEIKGSNEAVIKKVEHIGSSKFRVMMMALSYSITSEKLLYVDEITGGYLISNEFIIKNGKKVSLYKKKSYSHFDGLDEITGGYDIYKILGLDKNKKSKIIKDNK